MALSHNNSNRIRSANCLVEVQFAFEYDVDSRFGMAGQFDRLHQIAKFWTKGLRTIEKFSLIVAPRPFIHWEILMPGHSRANHQPDILFGGLIKNISSELGTEAKEARTENGETWIWQRSKGMGLSGQRRFKKILLSGTQAGLNWKTGEFRAAWKITHCFR